MAVLTPSALNTTRFQPGQAAGQITSAYMRDMVDSLAGLAATSQVTSYVAALVDAGTCVEMNPVNPASALTFTVPPNASVLFPIGTVIDITQMGTGQVTIAAGSGSVVLRTASSLTARAQYSTVSIRKRATDEWAVSGDLT